MPETIRNYVARSALMRKGGVHEKSRSAHRYAHKRQLNDTVAEYLEEIDEHKKTATAFDGSGRFSFIATKKFDLTPSYSGYPRFTNFISSQKEEVFSQRCPC